MGERQPSLLEPGKSRQVTVPVHTMQKPSLLPVFGHWWFVALGSLATSLWYLVRSQHSVPHGRQSPYDPWAIATISGEAINRVPPLPWVRHTLLWTSQANAGTNAQPRHHRTVLTATLDAEEAGDGVLQGLSRLFTGFLPVKPNPDAPTSKPSLLERGVAEDLAQLLQFMSSSSGGDMRAFAVHEPSIFQEDIAMPELEDLLQMTDGADDDHALIVWVLRHLQRTAAKALGLPSSPKTPRKRSKGFARTRPRLPRLTPKNWGTADRRAWSDALAQLHGLSFVCSWGTFAVPFATKDVCVVLPNAHAEDVEFLELLAYLRFEGNLAGSPDMPRPSPRLLQAAVEATHSYFARQGMVIDPRKFDKYLEDTSLAWRRTAFKMERLAAWFACKGGYALAARRFAKVVGTASWALPKGSVRPPGRFLDWISASAFASGGVPEATVRGAIMCYAVLLSRDGTVLHPEELEVQLPEAVRRAAGCRSFSLVGVGVGADAAARATAQAALDAALGRARTAPNSPPDGRTHPVPSQRETATAAALDLAARYEEGCVSAEDAPSLERVLGPLRDGPGPDEGGRKALARLEAAQDLAAALARIRAGESVVACRDTLPQLQAAERQALDTGCPASAPLVTQAQEAGATVKTAVELQARLVVARNGATLSDVTDAQLEVLRNALKAARTAAPAVTALLGPDVQSAEAVEEQWAAVQELRRAQASQDFTALKPAITRAEAAGVDLALLQAAPPPPPAPTPVAAFSSPGLPWQPAEPGKWRSAMPLTNADWMRG